MILPKPNDIIHKTWMYRVLKAIADDSFLASILRFKGGTCAAMQGYISRFSVDLDFDLIETDDLKKVRQHFEAAFEDLGLEIDDQSANVPQYFLKYQNKPGERNTLELDVTFPPPKSNDYEAVRLGEIDRIIYCQTLPTMFTNKLVAILDRFEKHGSIAGRDIFDVHTFFLAGYQYKEEIIKERTGEKTENFIKKLKQFIEKHFNQTIIDQDLNVLLPAMEFQKIRKILKQEVLMFLS